MGKIHTKMEIKNFYEKKNIYIFLVLIFPFAILFRSAFLNGYLVTISIIVLLEIFYLKNKIDFTKIEKKIIFLFLVFWIYLIVLSLLAENNYLSIKTSISQIRFFLFLFFLIFLVRINDTKIILFYKILTTLILFVSFDTIFQYFFRHDIFGLSPNWDLNPDRLSGPFGTELIVGGYLAFLSAPIVSQIIYKLNNTKNNLEIFLQLLILAIVFFAILLSGERMSLIFFLFNLFLSIIICFKKKIIKLLIFALSILLILSLFFLYNNSVQNRFNNFFDDINNFKNSNHYKLFSSAHNIWSENKIIGVGLKKFRDKCDSNKIDKSTGNKMLCSTHPHNFHLEFLSETGLIGSFLFIFFIFYYFVLIKKKFIKMNSKMKPFFLGHFIAMLFFIFPVKSSGSFFSTMTAVYFWYHMAFSILLLKYNSSKIFKNNY